MAEQVPTRREAAEPDAAPVVGPSSTRHEAMPVPPQARTRRETVPSRSTRREAAGNGATRREAVAPGPLALGATRREGPTGADPVVGGVPLPPELVTRLSELSPLPGGGEAQIYRVRDTELPADHRILKVYYPQFRIDAAVRTKLVALRSRHVVRIVSSGELADGRGWELMEYLPDGSLRDLGAGTRPFAATSVTGMVRQLTEGLAALHGLGITHRDLKPENVLVRSGPRPELVLTDFGLSRVHQATAHFTNVAMTEAYAPPESYVGQVSQRGDWWSLGIMVLELTTGSRPFSGLDRLMIQKAVTQKDVPVDAVADPRLRLLCAGLLVPDDAKRWGAAEVREWLAGRSPVVPDRRVKTDVRPLSFGGTSYHDPESLAAALAKDWTTAASRYPGARGGTSWAALKRWLGQFDDPARYPPDAIERRNDALDVIDRSSEGANAKLVRLLAALNPALPPIYRQAPIDDARLRSAAALVLDGDPADPRVARNREIVDELWRGRLLLVLAGFDGGDPLRAVEARWRGLVTEWRAATRDLGTNPAFASRFTDRDVQLRARAAMLELAAGANRGPDWNGALAARRNALPARVPWFDSVCAWVRNDPVRAFAALCLSGLAKAEADAAVQAQQAAEQARLAREHAWEQREQRRLSARGTAAGVALRGAGIVSGLWLLVGLFAARSPVLGVALVAVIAAFVAGELALANALAADYHPRYSLQQSLAVRGGRLGARMRGRPGLWALAVVVTLLVLGFVTAVVPVAALVAAVAQVWWAVARHRRWAAAHEIEHRQALQP